MDKKELVQKFKELKSFNELEEILRICGAKNTIGLLSKEQNAFLYHISNAIEVYQNPISMRYEQLKKEMAKTKLENCDDSMVYIAQMAEIIALNSLLNGIKDSVFNKELSEPIIHFIFDN